MSPVETKKKAKKKLGPRTKYKESMAQEAGLLCKTKGYTNQNLADHFGVHEGTIQNWVNKYPAFDVAIRDGKNIFNTKEVKQLLLRRCRGFDYDEKHYEKLYGKERLVKRITKHMPSDTTAIIFWLKNRDPEQWSDKQEITHEFTLADFMKAATLARREQQER